MTRRNFILLFVAILVSGCGSGSLVEYRVSGSVKQAQVTHSIGSNVHHRTVVTLPHVYLTPVFADSTETFMVRSSREKGSLKVKVFVDGKPVRSEHAEAPGHGIRVQLNHPQSHNLPWDEAFFFILAIGMATWSLVTVVSNDNDPKPPDEGEECPSTSDKKENSRARYLARVRDKIRRTE